MRARRTLAIGAAALALLAAGCADEATRDETGEITEEGELDVFSFRVGDCFDTGSDVDEVSGVQAKPCAEPHDAEVYHLFDVADGDYPGTEALQQDAADGCLDAFEPYVDEPYESSVLDIGFLWPTPETWDRQDDREIVCYLVHVEGEELTGSQEGAGV